MIDRNRALISTLKSIRSSSPMWRNGTWQPREAGVMWVVWMQAVQDVVKRNNPPPQSQWERHSARITATTGSITMPDGRKANALELIEIDPEWAWTRIRKALDYTEAA